MSFAPGSVSSYNIAPGQSQSDLDLKRRMAFALMQSGMDVSPVQHWTQGAARALQGALGGYELYQADQEDREDKAKTRGIVGELFGGQNGGASVPAPTPVPSAQPTAQSAPGMPSQNVAKALTFYQGKGLSPEDSAAMVWNFQQESGGKLNPGATHDGGTGVGIAGWNGPRRAALQKIASARGVPETDFDAQLEHSWSELNSTERGALDRIRAAKTPEEKASAAIGYFRPRADYAADRASRAGTVNALLGPQYAQAGPVGAPVEQPRGGATPERRQQLINSLMQTRSGAPYAQAIIGKELEMEQKRARPLTEEEKKVYPGAVAVKAGGEPIFPPPSTNVSLNAQNTSESEYAKGKAADALTLERGHDAALSERQRVEVFKSLVNDFKTGKLAPAQSTVAAWGDALGLDPKTLEKMGIPANAAVNGQLIESMSNQMTLGMIGNKAGEGGMPANNFSDADRKFLTSTAPGLGRVQGGNQILLEMKGRALDRQLEKTQMWDEYRSEKKSFEQFERDWRKHVQSQPSLFADIPDQIKQLSAQPASQSGPAAAGTAPSGVDPKVWKHMTPEERALWK